MDGEIALSLSSVGHKLRIMSRVLGRGYRTFAHTGQLPSFATRVLLVHPCNREDECAIPFIEDIATN